MAAPSTGATGSASQPLIPPGCLSNRQVIVSWWRTTVTQYDQTLWPEAEQSNYRYAERAFLKFMLNLFALHWSPLQDWVELDFHELKYHLIIWSPSGSLLDYLYTYESSINQSRQFQIIVWANSKKSSNTIGGNSSDPIRTRSRQELRGVSSTRSNESVEKIHEDNQPLSMNQSGPNNLNPIITSGQFGPMLGQYKCWGQYNPRQLQLIWYSPLCLSQEEGVARESSLFGSSFFIFAQFQLNWETCQLNL